LRSAGSSGYRSSRAATKIPVAA